MGTHRVTLGEAVCEFTKALDEGFLSDTQDIIIDLSGVYLLFSKLDVDAVMAAVRNCFYLCYGGWDIAFEYDEAHRCTGCFSFIPSQFIGFTGLMPVG